MQRGGAGGENVDMHGGGCDGVQRCRDEEEMKV